MRGFKNVVALSKICSQLHPLCEFDTPGEWLCERIVRVIVYTWLQILWWMLHSVIPMQSLALCNVVFYGRSKMSGSGSMQTKPVPAPWRGRKLKELSTSDNCRMCGCCFKTQFNFKSGWISSENMFVAPTRKGETLPELANLLKSKLFIFLDDGESLFMKVCSPCGTKVWNCAALLSQIREKLNTPTDNVNNVVF